MFVLIKPILLIITKFIASSFSQSAIFATFNMSCIRSLLLIRTTRATSYRNYPNHIVEVKDCSNSQEMSDTLYSDYNLVTERKLDKIIINYLFIFSPKLIFKKL